MIVDWARNCENILMTFRLTDDEPEDRVCSYKQEAMLFKYLQDVLNYTEEQIYECWCNISNGNAAKSIGDPDGQRKAFRLVKHCAESSEYQFYAYMRPLEPIKIYQSEIDFLNGTRAPLWARQFWCALLVYYKFQRQNLNPQFDEVLKTQWVTNWAIRQIPGIQLIQRRYYGHYQDELGKIQNQLPQRVILDRVHHGKNHELRFFKPSFYANEGQVVCELQDIKDINKVVALIMPPTMICPECGKVFEVNSKTQRSVCLSCWNIQRRRRKTILQGQYNRNRKLLQ